MESRESHDQDEDIAQMKENRKEIENKVARILKLLKNNGKDKTRKKTEIIGLINEFHKEYQLLCAQYEHLRGESAKRVGTQKEKENSSSLPHSDSDEFYSSEEIENGVLETNTEASEFEDANETLNSKHIEVSGKRKDHKRGNERKSKNEASGEIKELKEQLTMLRTDLESCSKLKNNLQVHIEEKETEAKRLQESNVQLQSQISKLELLMQEKGNEISEVTLKMTENEKNLTSRIEMLMAQVNERNEASAQVQGLQDEMETMKEEIARRASHEQGLQKEKERILVQMEDSKSKAKSLLDQNNKLEAMITCKTQEADKLKEEKDKLKARIQELEKPDSLLMEKSKLTNHSAQNLIEVEKNLKQKEEPDILAKTQSLDFQRLQKVDSSRSRLTDSSSSINYHALERKIVELSEMFQMKAENKFRLLSQRIRVAEQIHSETKDSYREILEKLEQENKELNEKNAAYEAEANKIKSVFSESGSNILTGLDLMVKKLDEGNGKFFNRIFKISNDLQLARDWIMGKNDEIKKLKQNLTLFSSKQDGENVECLETENPESQLERRVQDLEQQLKERNEILLSLSEGKREAIRQLCFLIDYHRNRYDHLKEAVSKMPLRFKTSA